MLWFLIEVKVRIIYDLRITNYDLEKGYEKNRNS